MVGEKGYSSAAFPDPTEDAFYEAEEEREHTVVSDVDEIEVTLEFEDTETADTLMMGSAVDVTDADAESQAMYREMASIYEDQFELFINKNMDYGSSFEIGGEIEMEMGDGPFDDAATANLYKLFTRIQDKNQRFYTQAFCNGSNNVNESLHETAKDAANYWMMVALLTNE